MKRDYDEVLSEYGIASYDENTSNNNPVMAESSVMKWIPVSERLPDDYSMSICVGHGGYRFICRKEPNGWFRFPQMKRLDGVTHWMPLPAAPDGDK